MTYRGLFLADGPSDLPLARHLEALCLRRDREVAIADVSAGKVVGGTVAARLHAILTEDPDFDIVFVHRDAEGQDPGWRYEEVRNGVEEAGFVGPSVAVVPVRMTESLLLLDEGEIRTVAGKPRGRAPLDLPTIGEAERLADPKDCLRTALNDACSLSGRRLKVFKREFNEKRRLLLERLDIDGPVQQLSSWRRLETDIDEALTAIA